MLHIPSIMHNSFEYMQAYALQTPKERPIRPNRAENTEAEQAKKKKEEYQYFQSKNHSSVKIRTGPCTVKGSPESANQKKDGRHI